MFIHFLIIYGCFHITIAALSNCNGDHLACKALNIYYLAFYRKDLLTSNCPHKSASRAQDIKLVGSRSGGKRAWEWKQLVPQA